ncbi:hypothetical protein KC19_2G082500 [Ceratodon purpureus]|uniref:Uncharacterized protein n=1 Tax=Ceratodon purpureus TaxID=3225 RepID=A0A8T0IVC7_CERPU|nr:hypothetical protein KC19_2G082500 [Ceratodon purpureus]
MQKLITCALFGPIQVFNLGVQAVLQFFSSHSGNCDGNTFQQAGSHDLQPRQYMSARREARKVSPCRRNQTRYHL